VPAESTKAKRLRAEEACRRLEELYPEAVCALHFTDPFSLVVAVLLSAQTTDVAVNKVTPVLFGRWPTPADLAGAPISEVEAVLRPLGFYRTKAQHVVDAARMVVSEFGGQVPRTMEELTRLPGVGRKTANIVLNDAFDVVEGIAVDTHVFRIMTRLGLTDAPTPLAAEQDILKVIPRRYWKRANHTFVLFGRQVCDARKPACVPGGKCELVAPDGSRPEGCPLADICPSVGRTGNPTAKAKASHPKGGSETPGTKATARTAKKERRG
jgi:endonuclease-3